MSYQPYSEPANTRMPLKERIYLFRKYKMFDNEPDFHKMRSLYVELYAKRCIKWGHKDPMIDKVGQ